MKIALMTLWNTTGGPSIHAELVAREWIKMGHKVTVFSNYASDFPHMWKVDGVSYPYEVLIREDEPFVTRNFHIPSWSSLSQLDPDPILRSDFDVLVVEALEKLPMRELLGVFPKMRKRAKTVLIMHEGKMPSDPDFYRFSWDSVICFDQRYLNLFESVFPNIIQTIPHPCHLQSKGNKEAARRYLGLEVERKIVLIFGFRIQDYLPIVPALSDLSRDFPLTLLVVSSNDVGIQRLLKASKEGLDVVVRRETATVEKLYQYLHASDVLLMWKRSVPNDIVVSSTAYLTLASGCPMIVRDSNYFDDLGDAVIRYSGSEELKARLTDVFEVGPRLRRCMEATEEFVKGHSAEIIARKHIELFKSLCST